MIDEYFEKLYSGFLGMNIGIRLGAPVEPNFWSYERILQIYGEVKGYLKEYKNFAADDDANGPVFFLRALLDDAINHPLEPQDVAHAWLNYSREGIGMFWWGGYGISTEHTAFLNLKHGIPAPLSGSIQQNGQILAEQIGGQIFIDTWGLVNPANPKRAADYGQIAASVSHDGNGLWGARFMCAAISKAFECCDVSQIIAAGLEQIPKTCTYRSVCESVIAFHDRHPENWRDCYHMLHDNWGYDKFPGICHIIPNAGVCIMALLYGNGHFDRSIQIATMAGWDTDCNAGNVGTILGVAYGIHALDKRYLDPINDGIVCSSISGYLNILDIPSFCREVAMLGYRLSGEPIPNDLQRAYRPGEIYFDFELPGSTHNFRVSNPFLCKLSNSRKYAFTGNGSLEILIDKMNWNENCRIFYKPFYTRDDFSDERYSPVFSPTAYSGQTVSMQLYWEQWEGDTPPGITPYVRTRMDQVIHTQDCKRLVVGNWIAVSFIIPETKGDVIDEVGIVLEAYTPPALGTCGTMYLDDFTISGKAEYSIDPAKQQKEFNTITPFSVDQGAWNIEQNTLSQMRYNASFAYTGNYYSQNYIVSATVTPYNGTSHMLTVRAQGSQRSYSAGLGDYGKAVIVKNDFGFTTLASCDFPWIMEHPYLIEISCQDDLITLYIDGNKVASITDSAFRYGMFGCGSCHMGRTSYGTFTYHDL